MKLSELKIGEKFTVSGHDGKTFIKIRPFPSRYCYDHVSSYLEEQSLEKPSYYIFDQDRLVQLHQANLL